MQNSTRALLCFAWAKFAALRHNTRLKCGPLVSVLSKHTFTRLIFSFFCDRRPCFAARRLCLAASRSCFVVPGPCFLAPEPCFAPPRSCFAPPRPWFRRARWRQGPPLLPSVPALLRQGPSFAFSDPLHYMMIKATVQQINR